MSKPRRVGDPQDQIAQWITDEESCAPFALHSVNTGLIVEVSGDLGGKGVTFNGSNVNGEDMPFLAYTKLSPWLKELPPVLFIQPVTEAVGVTITVRGIK